VCAAKSKAVESAPPLNATAQGRWGVGNEVAQAAKAAVQGLAAVFTFNAWRRLWCR
jgi:hypothetical protein